MRYRKIRIPEKLYRAIDYFITQQNGRVSVDDFVTDCLLDETYWKADRLQCIYQVVCNTITECKKELMNEKLHE